MMEPSAQQEQKQLLNTAHLVLFALFSVGCSVQLYSRVPGTTGPHFFGIYFWIGQVIQIWYYEANVQVSRRADAFPFSWLFGLNVVWLLLHFLLRQLQKWRGAIFHSLSPGVGLFADAFSWLGSWNGPLSDLLVAGLLSGIFFATDSPIMGSWFRSMIFWLILRHGLLHAREKILLQRMNDARIDSKYWSHRIPRS